MPYNTRKKNNRKPDQRSTDNYRFHALPVRLSKGAEITFDDAVGDVGSAVGDVGSAVGDVGSEVGSSMKAFTSKVGSLDSSLGDEFYNNKITHELRKEFGHLRGGKTRRKYTRKSKNLKKIRKTRKSKK
jgi:hypothetical protein